MSSQFSSTKVNCSSLKSRISTPRSPSWDVSEHSTSASKSSRKPSSLSESMSKDVSKSSSNGSAKLPSKASSGSSLKSSHRHKFNKMLDEINSNYENNNDNTLQAAPALSRYVNSTTISNPLYTLSSNTIVKADYQARMQALLDGFDDIYGGDEGE